MMFWFLHAPISLSISLIPRFQVSHLTEGLLSPDPPWLEDPWLSGDPPSCHPPNHHFFIILIINDNHYHNYNPITLSFKSSSVLPPHPHHNTKTIKHCQHHQISLTLRTQMMINYEKPHHQRPPW